LASDLDLENLGKKKKKKVVVSTEPLEIESDEDKVKDREEKRLKSRKQIYKMIKFISKVKNTG
jgi:hypothetical protein